MLRPNWGAKVKSLNISLLGLLACVSSVIALAEVAPPAPVEPVPSARQLAWHTLEFYGFVHFTVNTFTDKEWGDGDESPAVFNPTALDVRQWVSVAKDAGMKGLIVTAKHHDGFCLWPSKYTEHSIKNSPYKAGKGNIVGDLAKACADAGLKFGVYLSPWDRNHADYGRPAYVEYYRNQLRELLTENGPIQEVWFDGANGGTGYYGGAREKRTIDRTTYYGWPTTWDMVRKLQPNALMFSDVGPDIRWVGNESGFAGEPCWATYTPVGPDGKEAPAPGYTKYQNGVNGQSDGKYWLPAEVDVSIRPGWFYHAKEDGKVKSPEELRKIYYESVGRGASLLLNVPPDQRGLIHENDVASLRGLRKLLDATFATNLAASAKVSATNVRGKSAQFAATNVIDTDRSTYWATDDGVTDATLELTLDKPKTFNNVLLQEYIELGQRILKFAVEARVDGAWRTIAEGTSVGWKRLLRTDSVTADAVRIHIESAKACPTLSTVGLYQEAKL